ncbi:hypothetical protein QUC30_13215 [Aeromonas caviae]|uniref:hypothetical protein n=1 Tax=Aeromonas caviae TaxID=648 RepID=UPI003D2EEFD9
MNGTPVCLMLGLLSASAMANDSFNSELSHVVGGAAMGAGFTAIADHYGYREHRGWIGFGISTGIGIAAELIERASGQGPFSALDAGAMRWGPPPVPTGRIAGCWHPWCCPSSTSPD